MSPPASVDSSAHFFKTPHISRETKQKLSANFQNDLGIQKLTVRRSTRGWKMHFVIVVVAKALEIGLCLALPIWLINSYSVALGSWHKWFIIGIVVQYVSSWGPTGAKDAIGGAAYLAMVVSAMATGLWGLAGGLVGILLLAYISPLFVPLLFAPFALLSPKEDQR
jgi:hypothetical protein